jgi:salicylate hydroxylase
MEHTRSNPVDSSVEKCKTVSLAGMTNIKLNVVVVGGGIAGLTTALALRKQGHMIIVVESSSWLKEAGAAVALPPNSSRTLMHLGVDVKNDVKAARLQSTKEYHFTRTDRPPKFGDNGDGRVIPWAGRCKDLGLINFFFMAHRVDLHDAIRHECISTDGPGQPVEIILASKVVAWDSVGSITLQNGEQMHADLIVAADGVHSIAHEAILGWSVPARPSGITAMRFLLKTQDILDDPKTASFMDDGPGCFSYYADASRKT